MYSHRKLFLEHCAQTSPAPAGLEIMKAKGIYLTDIRGKKYIDLISGISVSALGHRHPEVVRAVRKQAGHYMHLMVYGEFIQHPQVKAAKELADSLSGELTSVYFTNSGSEAIEAAMKLAKRATGRYEFAGMENAYHGSTQGALSLMGNAYFREAYRPLLPGVTFLRFNDLNDLEKITCRHAAVFCETIQGEAGAKTPEKEWMQKLRKKCDDTGALLILDEIQSGMGRTGCLWAFEDYGIVPDILVSAKGLGGGMPIGAMVASPRLMKNLSENPVLGHITTFGGHPVSAAAAYATLRFIRQNKLWENAQNMEQVIREHLSHERINYISGKGLLLSVEMDNSETNFHVIKDCMENGLISDWFLFNDRSLRIAPPLIIDEKTIIKACRKITTALDRT
jgi:acetylornithine/succinyldiaminopimelate/putrescine aminotransferase